MTSTCTSDRLSANDLVLPQENVLALQEILFNPLGGNNINENKSYVRIIAIVK